MHWYKDTPRYRKGIYKLPRASSLGSSGGCRRKEWKEEGTVGKGCLSPGRGVCMGSSHNWVLREKRLVGKCGRTHLRSVVVTGRVVGHRMPIICYLPVKGRVPEIDSSG